MMEELDLSYSCLLIHICWKVDSQARMKPPIHTEHLPSGAAMILIIILGPRTMIACILLMMPWADGGPTRQHCVGVEVLADVDIILRDEVEGDLVDSTGFHNQEGRLEEHLRAVEPLIADSDDLSS